jgi:hypothetical protein
MWFNNSAPQTPNSTKISLAQKLTRSVVDAILHEHYLTNGFFNDLTVCYAEQHIGSHSPYYYFS